MTNEEWASKSDDWRKGWRYAQGDVTIEPNTTSEFIAGYMYANEHLEGSCYSVSATTGDKGR